MANLGPGQGFWAVILPKATENLATNPSLEMGSAGWSALAGGATIGTTSYTQAFGAWSLQINHTTTSEGAFLNMGTPAAGSYSLSALINGTSGHRYRLMAESASGAALGAGSITAAGGWQSIITLFGLASGTGLNIVARHIDSANGTFYLDGVQLESGTFPTSYIDGDQPGGTWTGAPHVSSSTRTGQYRGGGSVIALADLGLSVDQMLGVGVGPVEVSMQSFAVTAGAQFQRQRPGARKFTLTGKPIMGTSLADFHVTRRTLYDVFKPDLVSPQQPVRFMYVGGQGTQVLDAFYSSGLELGNMDGVIAENAAISFVSPDPYWYAPTQQGTTLAPRVAIGSTNFMAQRSPLGKWGSVGQAAGPNQVVYDLLNNGAGTIFAAGSFSAVDGTAGAKYLAQYIPATNTWGTLIGGTASDYAYSLAYSPSGTLFYSGNFTTVAGTAGARFIARWANNAHGTTQGGTTAALTAVPPTLLYSPTGTLFAGGDFTTVAGTASGPVAFWHGANWGTLPGGSLSQTTYVLVYDLLWAKDNSLYAAGSFTRAGGTIANNIARFAKGASAWGTMGGGFVWPGNTSIGTGLGASLTQAPNGVLFVGGIIGTLGNTTATPNIIQWNGVSESAVGGGIGYGTVTAGAVSFVFKVSANPQTGQVLATGGNWGGVVGSVLVPDNMAIWNGASWLPLDIDIDDATAQIRAVEFTPQGGMLLGGLFSGTAHAASVGTIVNTGRAEVYPNLRLRNLGAGTARIYQMLNTTTGDGIYFNYSMLPSEQIALTLQPGQRSFQSSSFGNILNSILPGSNLSTFSLLGGTNYISFFSDNDSVEASFFWTPVGHSIDSGTIT